MTYFQPLLPTLVLICLWMCWRLRRSPGAWIVYVASALLFLVTFQPLAWLLLYPLEGKYSSSPLPQQDAEAIVVLSSAVFGASPPLTRDILGSDTYERCLY